MSVRASLAAAALLALATPTLAAEGAFAGLSGHSVKGAVLVAKAGGKITVTLDKAFALDNAPDAYVALGTGSKLAEGGVLGKLKSKTGAQTYSVPVSAALEGASEVIIWCKQYAVPLGVAALK